MKTIKILLIAVLVIIAYSASAQWSTSTGNTTTSDFVGIDYLTNPVPTQPLIKLAVANEAYFGGRVNFAGNAKAFTSTGKWTLGWGALLGANMEFYSSTNATKPGQLNFTFGGAASTGYVEFRQSNGSGGFTSCLFVNNDGKVGIGTATPARKLSVDGNIGCDTIFADAKIYAREVEVTLSTFPDYVFDEEYHLSPLLEVEQFIKENKHLKGVPTATEVVQNGLPLGEMNKILMEKVEELTLYVIELQKQVDELKNK
jgi:hypothetical protein